MDLKNIGGIVAGFVIAVVLLASVLVPVISSTLVTAGDEITITNNSAVVLREVQPGDVLKCERTVITQGSAYSDEWTLNGEILSNIAGGDVTWNAGIISDGIYLQITATDFTTAGTYYDMSRSIPSQLNIGAGNLEAGEVATWTCTFGDSTITVVDRLDNSTEYAYTWGYVVCPYDDGEYYSAETGGTGVCKTVDDLILCGTYTTGDLDTAYYYCDGDSYVSNTSYTIDVPYELSLHTGTTDIYDITASVEISDGTTTETFTPYRLFLPYEVTGHADSGAMYSLLNIIPLLVTVGILMGIVTAVFVRRE